MRTRVIELALCQWYPNRRGQKIYRRSAKNTVTKLKLSGIFLLRLPIQLDRFPLLTSLSLSDNFMGQLGNSIGRLHQLERLNLSGNDLTNLPPSFAQLINLTWLNLDWNHFSSVPPVLPQLTDLRQLHLEHNRFGYFHDIPNDLELLGTMTHLQELSLGHNGLSKLPANFASLTQLQSLDLTLNDINYKKLLPPSMHACVRHE